MTMTATINIYLNTWGNYNENGADGGFWVSLPCDLDEELEKLAASTGEELEKLAASTGEELDEMEPFINDYETDVDGLEISEYDDIAELNELAEELAGLDEYDLEKIGAIMEAHGGTLREALDNIDDYTFYQGMSLEDVAYQLVDECYDLPEFAKTYFDYAAFARDLGFDGYAETDNGVICR